MEIHFRFQKLKHSLCRQLTGCRKISGEDKTSATLEVVKVYFFEQFFIVSYQSVFQEPRNTQKWIAVKKDPKNVGAAFRLPGDWSRDQWYQRRLPSSKVSGVFVPPIRMILFRPLFCSNLENFDYLLELAKPSLLKDIHNHSFFTC